jgi:GNAT superfamily N-acetyltransferase
MGWWPKPEHGYIGYLSPLPAFASMAVPIMFLIDWWLVFSLSVLCTHLNDFRRLNRPYFETLTQEALRRPDIVDIKSYYSRSPSSGFWILEYGTTFVGFIALDASLDAESNDPVTSEKQVSKKKGTSRIAVIRHFYVEEQYRGIGIEKDLLDYAVRHAFSSDSTLRTIKAVDSPLVQHVRECLRSGGFQLQKHTKTVGMMGWKLGERVLERSEWEKADKEW